VGTTVIDPKSVRITINGQPLADRSSTFRPGATLVEAATALRDWPRAELSLGYTVTVGLSAAHPSDMDTWMRQVAEARDTTYDASYFGAWVHRRSRDRDVERVAVVEEQDLPRLVTWQYPDGKPLPDAQGQLLAACEASVAASTALRNWPRVEQAEQILAFVAAGGWAADEVEQFVADTFGAGFDTDARAHQAFYLEPLAARIVRRAKAEHRVYWCPRARRYEAMPAWRHRRLPARHPWPWPVHASGRR